MFRRRAYRHVPRRQGRSYSTWHPGRMVQIHQQDDLEMGKDFRRAQEEPNMGFYLLLAVAQGFRRWRRGRSDFEIHHVQRLQL
jgi:hypothetical protein